METNEPLPKAPIREAIIDLRLASELDISGLVDELNDSLPLGYTGLSPMFRNEVQFTLKDRSVETTERKALRGFRSDNSDKGFTVLFHGNGITVSKLWPYTTWNDFKLEAAKLWGVYKKLLQEVKFSRIAVRYINEIELPFTNGKLDFDHYITNCPNIPAGMPDQLMHFLSRIVVPYEKILTLATVTLSLGNANAKFIPLTIDIDIYRDQKLDIPEEQIWDILEEYRNVKNSAFFGIITENTKELCK